MMVVGKELEPGRPKVAKLGSVSFGIYLILIVVGPGGA
jgi:hypothetical protein